MTLPKPFLSDNAAAVHPRLWEAMRKADERAEKERQKVIADARRWSAKR